MLGENLKLALESKLTPLYTWAPLGSLISLQQRQLESPRPSQLPFHNQGTAGWSHPLIVTSEAAKSCVSHTLPSDIGDLGQQLLSAPSLPEGPQSKTNISKKI